MAVCPSSVSFSPVHGRSGGTRSRVQPPSRPHMDAGKRPRTRTPSPPTQLESVHGKRGASPRSGGLLPPPDALHVIHGWAVSGPSKAARRRQGRPTMTTRRTLNREAQPPKIPDKPQGKIPSASVAAIRLGHCPAEDRTIGGLFKVLDSLHHRTGLSDQLKRSL